MTLNDRVEELKKVKSELKRLYREKYAIEKQIIKELDNFELEEGKNQRITLDNVSKKQIIDFQDKKRILFVNILFVHNLESFIF